MSEQINTRFWRLAVVNILSNLMVPLAGLVDLAFLGHLAEIRHLAGVAIATVLFNYIYWTFGFLRMATTGTTAQAMGKGEEETAKIILLRNMTIALSIATIILILQQPLREFGFALLTASPEVLTSGKAYYNALIWGAPATLLNFVLFGWYLGKERVDKVLLLSIVDKGANIVLDYLFIVVWGWASAGAGWATAISQYFNLLLGFWFVSREIPLGTWKNFSGKLGDRAALLTAFRLNGDILVRTLALVSTFALFTNLSGMMGTVVLAANTLLMQIVTLAAYFIDGIALATESIAGSLRGANNQKQLLSLIKLSGISSLALGLSVALLFCLFPESLFSLLTDRTILIDRIAKDVWWLLPILGFGSIAFMLDGYFLGLSEGKILRQSTIISALLGFAPCAIAAWHLQTNSLLWLALSGFMAARAITLGWKAITNRY